MPNPESHIPNENIFEDDTQSSGLNTPENQSEETKNPENQMRIETTVIEMTPQEVVTGFETVSSIRQTNIDIEREANEEVVARGLDPNSEEAHEIKNRKRKKYTDGNAEKMSDEMVLGVGEGEEKTAQKEKQTRVKRKIDNHRYKGRKGSMAMSTEYISCVKNSKDQKKAKEEFKEKMKAELGEDVTDEEVNSIVDNIEKNRGLVIETDQLMRMQELQDFDREFGTDYYTQLQKDLQGGAEFEYAMQKYTTIMANKYEAIGDITRMIKFRERQEESELLRRGSQNILKEEIKAAMLVAKSETSKIQESGALNSIGEGLKNLSSVVSKQDMEVLYALSKSGNLSYDGNEIHGSIYGTPVRVANSGEVFVENVAVHPFNAEKFDTVVSDKVLENEGVDISSQDVLKNVYKHIVNVNIQDDRFMNSKEKVMIRDYINTLVKSQRDPNEALEELGITTEGKPDITMMNKYALLLRYYKNNSASSTLDNVISFNDLLLYKRHWEEGGNLIENLEKLREKYSNRDLEGETG